MQPNDRLNKITHELSKLNNLIELTKNQSMIAMQLLKNCHSDDSSDEQQKELFNDNAMNQQSLDVSSQLELENNERQFDEADSTSTILIPNHVYLADPKDLFTSTEFNQNQSLQMSRPIPDNNSSQVQMRTSNLSSEPYATIQISQIKPIDTTVKKAKLLKSNKHKKNLFYEKQRVLSKNQKAQKINRIKSQNKLHSNNIANIKKGVNLVSDNFRKDRSINNSGNVNSRTVGNLNQGNNGNIANNIKNITIPTKNYLSSKIQTLNSKRNVKYNSITKHDKSHEYNNKQKLYQTNNQKHQSIKQKPQKSSKSRFHINLQKQVTMKITDLKLKKNLCQIETSYLSASVKITKEQLLAISEPATVKYTEETLLKYFILKSIIKFISQYNDETWTTSEDIQIDNEKVSNTIKKPERFIKIINKLPDILRRRNIVSEGICREFIEDRAFVEQKVGVMASGKMFVKEPLHCYLAQLHAYIQFLLNNSMIHETKRHKIFNPTNEDFFSDRSAKEMKLANTHANKESKFLQSKPKEFSERKKPSTTQLKRVNTSKALKKGVTAQKPKKL